MHKIAFFYICLRPDIFFSGRKNSKALFVVYVIKQVSLPRFRFQEELSSAPNLDVPCESVLPNCSSNCSQSPIFPEEHLRRSSTMRYGAAI